MNKYILFAGRKQVGKSTSAEICKSILNSQMRHAHIVSFADALKEDVERIFDIPLSKLNGSDADKNELSNIRWRDFSWAYRHSNISPGRIEELMTNRQIMQYYGQMMREEINEDIWINRALNNRDEGHNNCINNCIRIIPDGRYPNEVNACIKNNGLPILILRNNGLSDVHASEQIEQHKSLFNHIIVNNGSLDDLAASIRHILRLEEVI